MANENIISWNFANWVTVVVMASVMFALFGLGAKYMQKQAANSTASKG